MCVWFAMMQARERGSIYPITSVQRSNPPSHPPPCASLVIKTDPPETSHQPTNSVFDIDDTPQIWPRGTKHRIQLRSRLNTLAWSATGGLIAMRGLCDKQPDRKVRQVRSVVLLLYLQPEDACCQQVHLMMKDTEDFKGFRTSNCFVSASGDVLANNSLV